MKNTAIFSKILVIDDEQAIREQLVRWLKYKGYQAEQAASAKEALAWLRQTHFHVILLDMILPDMNGLELLKKLCREHPEICVIILTAFGNEDSPEQARAAGAFDFFAKPIHYDGLIHRIDTAITQFRLQRAIDERLAQERQRFDFENIVGRSAAMRKVLEMIQAVAATETTVLIQGESGTGKELVAGAIHYNSPRRTGPYEIANCAALSESLAENELFGHEKGAYTDASSAKRGKFERAEGGTLFMDEVGELSLQLQQRFLRFLEDKTFERLGGELVTVDARIVAATNRNLAEAVAQERFRRDLFHRLHGFVIEVPPLRERREDIPLLAEHFIQKNNRQNSKQIAGISAAALELLMHYQFPGNVRELEKMIDSAILLEKQETIQPETIRQRLQLSEIRAPADYSHLPYREAKEQFDRDYFNAVLQRFNQHVTKTAEFAGLDRSHVTNRIKALGLRGGEA